MVARCTESSWLASVVTWVWNFEVPRLTGPSQVLVGSACTWAEVIARFCRAAPITGMQRSSGGSCTVPLSNSVPAVSWPATPTSGVST